MLSVTISAQIIIIPIMTIKFNTISLTFFISSILTGFLIGIIVISGYILTAISFIIPFIAKLGFQIYNLILNLFIFIVEICSKLPLSQIYITTPNIMLIIIYYSIILLFRFSFLKKEHIKKIFIGFFIIILLTNIFKINSNNLTIHFIDVGQGDSTLIITPTNKRILVDSGGSKLKEEYDVGENTLVPYLLNRGIKKLDYIIISHFDADHCNGFIAVLDKIKVGKILISKQAEITNKKIYQYKLLKKEIKFNLIILHIYKYFTQQKI